VPVTEQTPFRRAHEQLAEAIQASAELKDLEHELLDQLPLSRDARDALWLFAWATIDRRDRHRAPRRWHRLARPPSARHDIPQPSS
jgi:hypothetical protein